MVTMINPDIYVIKVECQKETQREEWLVSIGADAFMSRWKIDSEFGGQLQKQLFEEPN